MNAISIDVAEHPKLDLAAFSLKHSDASAAQGSVMELLSLDAKVIEQTPFDTHTSAARYDEVKAALRDLLRHGGYKPTGRGKPASEYLVKAVSNGKLGSINPIVDTLNVVSLHSALPISVVDLARCNLTSGSLSIAIAPESSEYVFNVSGQTIKLDGLLCLFDDDGPCANGVKDSQRTKTGDTTDSSLVIIWGTKDLPERSAKTETWFRQLIATYGLGLVETVTISEISR